MNKEIKLLIKIAVDVVDQISENITDLKERQEHIKIALFSFLGTITGLYVYNAYIKDDIRETSKKDDETEKYLEQPPELKPELNTKKSKLNTKKPELNR